MKVVLFANTDWYLYNFRLALGVELLRHGAEVLAVAPPGSYSRMLEKAGLRWIPVEMNRGGLNPVSEIAVIRTLARLYRAERPDLVHHFTIKPVIYGSLAARLAGVPAVVNAVAGLGYVFSSRTPIAVVLRPLVLALLRLSLGSQNARLIVQNPDDQAFFLRTGLVRSDRIHLIRGSGVNTVRFSPAARVVLAKPVVMLATRLLWEKGVGDYVEAVRSLRQAGVDARFLLAGAPDEGNPGAVPVSQLRRWSDDGLVEWLGHVGDMATVLRGVDICVLPTTYGEGVPRILVEAAACGLPAVATAVAGCREIVDHGVTGLLVTPKRPAELARAIHRLLVDADLRQAMGRRAREKALREFDENLVIHRTFEVYRCLRSDSSFGAVQGEMPPLSHG